jgi:DNA modification methylase
MLPPKEGKVPVHIDMVLTDIPYNISQTHSGLREIDFGAWDKGFSLESVWPSIPIADNIYIWCANEQLSHILTKLISHNYSTRAIAWAKTAPSPMNGEHIWLSGMELCAFGKLSGATFNGHCETNVITMNSPRNKQHPTQKPLALFQKLIQNSSNPGDMIYDPYAGSGTTLRAAKDLGRHAVGVEISEEYCEIAAQRLQQEVFVF